MPAASTPILDQPSTDRSLARPGAPRASEHALVMAAKRGGRDRDRLVQAFLPLVGSVARRYRNAPGVERSELMQEGVAGLLRSLERYDPERGTPFWAYASWWVRQGMQQLVSELAGPTVLSDRASRRLADVREARRARSQRQGREATFDELQEDTGLSSEHLARLLAAERSPRSLQEPSADDDAPPLGDTIADPWAEDAYEHATERVVAERVPAMLSRLNEREQTVVHARFGLDCPEQTLRELGEVLGVSPERVRQVERGALDKLHDWLCEPACAAGAR